MDSPALNQEVASNDFSNVMSGSVSAPIINSGISSQGDSTICNIGPPAISNMVSLDKSPMKTANFLTQTFAQRHDNADAYTICTARVTKMQPSYLYLTNVIALSYYFYLYICITSSINISLQSWYHKVEVRYKAQYAL
jgi:hypothetical protein